MQVDVAVVVHVSLLFPSACPIYSPTDPVTLEAYPLICSPTDPALCGGYPSSPLLAPKSPLPKVILRPSCKTSRRMPTSAFPVSCWGTTSKRGS
ncbi:hypothetical protein RvY_17987-2 [Ramazzottius varieornatus]|uniref:Uncharacterized protein n=1 Tax=Ramazzottius varieornatus TaxID=947166 RepID=A0A1D1W4A3_RAMVA|nr:hypothetical protein RvY_17987-2 [Ramazzottius varieornatus]